MQILLNLSCEINSFCPYCLYWKFDFCKSLIACVLSFLDMCVYIIEELLSTCVNQLIQLDIGREECDTRYHKTQKFLFVLCNWDGLFMWKSEHSYPLILKILGGYV